MTSRAVETSPQIYARLGGILYLMIIIAGALGEIFIRGKVIITVEHNHDKTLYLWRNL